SGVQLQWRSGTDARERGVIHVRLFNPGATRVRGEVLSDIVNTGTGKVFHARRGLDAAPGSYDRPEYFRVPDVDPTAGVGASISSPPPVAVRNVRFSRLAMARPADPNGAVYVVYAAPGSGSNGVGEITRHAVAAAPADTGTAAVRSPSSAVPSWPTRPLPVK